MAVSQMMSAAAAWDDAAHWPQYSRFLRRAQQHSWNPWGLDVGLGTVRPVRNTERPRSVRRALDVGFLVDATGSMGDEMTFLQSELKDIVRRVRAMEPDLDIRVSVVFYRDRGDAFITKSLPFTRRVDEAVAFIAGTTADGGGDYPEDMNAGLEAMMRQGWSRDAVPQMLFLLADAPPQQYAARTTRITRRSRTRLRRASRSFRSRRAASREIRSYVSSRIAGRRVAEAR